MLIFVRFFNWIFQRISYLVLDNKRAGLDRFAGKVEMMKNVRKSLKWGLIRALVHV